MFADRGLRRGGGDPIHNREKFGLSRVKPASKPLPIASCYLSIVEA
jgi:hypothetical protein